MTLELSTLIGIDPRTSGSKVCDFILYIYVFYINHIVFKYLFICCDRFREPRIDFQAPYAI